MGVLIWPVLASLSFYSIAGQIGSNFNRPALGSIILIRAHHTSIVPIQNTNGFTISILFWQLVLTCLVVAAGYHSARRPVGCNHWNHSQCTIWSHQQRSKVHWNAAKFHNRSAFQLLLIPMPSNVFVVCLCGSDKRFGQNLRQRTSMKPAHNLRRTFKFPTIWNGPQNLGSIFENWTQARKNVAPSFTVAFCIGANCTLMKLECNNVVFQLTSISSASASDVKSTHILHIHTEYWSRRTK